MSSDRSLGGDVEVEVEVEVDIDSDVDVEAEVQIDVEVEGRCEVIVHISKGLQIHPNSCQVQSLVSY